MTRKGPKLFSLARWSVAGALLLLAVVQLQASPGSGGPQVGPNLRLNAPQLPFPKGKLGRAGVAVAADEEGRHLVAAWETIQGTCGSAYGEACPPPSPPGLTAFGYSVDGGRTWTDAGAPQVVDQAMTAGHPWLDRGGVDRRTFFLVSRARSPVDRNQLGLTFHRGGFKEGVFAWQDGKLLAPRTAGDVWRGPSIAAAGDGSGKVFVAFSNLRAICGVPGRSAGQIELLRSGDEGRSWEGPVVVGPDDTVVTPDPKDPACGNRGTFQLSPSVAVGPAGEVYVIWPFGPAVTNANPLQTAKTLSLRFSRSLDGGRTFSAPRDLVTLNSMRENPPAGYSKDNMGDIPRIAVAASGPQRGRIYVTYASALAPVASAATEQSLASSQVYLVSSADQGLTWSAPVPLGPPVPPTGVKRFWPAVAVEAGGGVGVLYAESQERQATPAPDDRECAVPLLSKLQRAGKVSSLVDLHWVQSVDGGATFDPPLRVTSETSNWCTVSFDTAGFLFSNFGDYLGLSAGRNRAFAVWTDGRGGVPDAYFAEIQGAGAAASAGPK